MRLILLGPPGSGKGTQAERLCHRQGLEHIGTGDILRQAIAARTPAGERARLSSNPGSSSQTTWSTTLSPSAFTATTGRTNSSWTAIRERWPRRPRSIWSCGNSSST
jgi:cytidylate kinase